MDIEVETQLPNYNKDYDNTFTSGKKSTVSIYIYAIQPMSVLILIILEFLWHEGCSNTTKIDNTTSQYVFVFSTEIIYGGG